ncbi:MAG: O-antigen ligase family protein [Lentisphaeria bacterium]|nr:O-antigen ligase family protein [Lentisphaeria bacterium]
MPDSGVITKVSVIFAIVFIALTMTGYIPGLYCFTVLALLVLLFFRQRLSAGGLSSSNNLFRIGVVAILGCSATLLPLPYFMVGEHRAEAFHRAAELKHRLSGIDDNAALSSAAPSFTRFLIQGATRALKPAAGHEMIDRADRPVRRRVWPSLTLNRAGTIRTLFLITGFFCCFWLGAGSDAGQRRQCVIFLIVLGAACALTGIISRCVIPQGKTILWLFSVRHGTPIGPFINRNHFAFLCALLIPPCLLLCTRKPPLPDRPEETIPLAKTLAARLFFLLCGLVLTGGVVVSLSRSGFLVMVAGLIVVIMYSAVNRFSQAFTLIFIVCLIAFGIFLSPFTAFHERLSTLKDPLETNSARIRFQVWKDAVGIWRKYPLFGAGSDAFRVVYPTQKTSLSRKGASHAENEYVQILADNGLIGAGLALAAVFTFSKALFNGLGKSTNRPRAPDGAPSDTGLFTGIALSVLTGCAVHACLDFGLRIPLNALTVACLLGCAYPAPPRRGEPTAGSAGEKSPVPWWRRMDFHIAAGLIFFTILTRVYWLAAWRMDQYAFLQGRSAGTQIKAVAWAPTYWFPWYETGKRCLDMSSTKGGKKTPQGEALAKLGNECVQTAAALNSSDYRIWIAVARIAFQQGDFSTADHAARRVIELRPYRKDDVKRFLQTQ